MEGKATLRFLVKTAAYQVLTNPAVSTHTASLSEEAREALAEAIAGHFIVVLNAYRNTLRKAIQVIQG